jgi:hypothetical protein
MNLIILAVSDLDPDGDATAHSLEQRLRDDYDISEATVIKAALTMKQVAELELPRKYERAKSGSPNYKRYLNAYDTDCVWELEALDPMVLQNLLTVAIESLIDLEAYNAEVKAEAKTQRISPLPALAYSTYYASTCQRRRHERCRSKEARMHSRLLN